MRRLWKYRSRALLSLSFVAVAMGMSTHAVGAITVAWGDNSVGHLGNGLSGSAFNSSVPVYVTGLSGGVTVVSGGGFQSFAIENGAAKAWGAGTLGRLGNGGQSNSAVPVDVSGLSSGVTAISSGETHTLAVQNGAAKAWGEGLDGQMGNGTNNFSNLVPLNVTGLSSGVTAVAAGMWRSGAIQNGGVKAWGNSYDNVPVSITGLTSGVTHLAAGNAHFLAIQNGALKAWGSGGNGRLGNGASSSSGSVPVDVTGMSSGVTAIAGGFYHSLAVQNGNVYAWGRNSEGALGNNSVTDSNVPVLVLNLAVDIVAVSAGESSSYALTADGKLYAWGWGIYGELGLGHTNNRYVPTLVPTPAGYVYTSIDAGSHHVIATIAAVVPEPASLSLLALGCTAMLRRRQRH